MRALLTTIGTRGDVRPLVAVAERLRAHGHEARLCVPPDFRAWIEALGFTVIPLGPELRAIGAATSATPITPEIARRMVDGSIGLQFETIGSAARGCDVVVAATAIVNAASSVAELLGVGYVFAAYCPEVFPSARHAPIPIPGHAPPPGADHAELWRLNAERFHETFGAAVDARRVAAGLAPLDDLRSHVFTDRPWLAADPTLAPWPDPPEGSVLQTGAWILPDERPLPPEVERFLDAGEAPVYFGFGTVGAPQTFHDVIVKAARSLGRRAIVFRDWADVAPADPGPDVLVVGELNQQALFERIAAAVHHGGAGTTTQAALSGVPQVVVPQRFDQPYFARQVERLGIGVAHARGAPTVESLIRALEQALRPDVAARTRAVAGTMTRDGADVAARRLITGEPT